MQYLRAMKKTLVIGASHNPERYSNIVIKRLLDKGHEVLALGKKPGTIEGVPVHTTREDFRDIDTVSLYLNKDNQRDFYDYIISLKPRRVIFNPGTENPEFYDLLMEQGIEVDLACSMVLLASDQY